jgi:Rieske Fe-S protein
MGPYDDEQQLNPPIGDARQEAHEEPQPVAESVEQYVRLHEHIERLRADRRPRLPGQLSDDEIRAYQMAALFRAAAPRADAPDPVFVSRLLDELAQLQPAPAAPDKGPQTPSLQTSATRPAEVPRKRRTVSRRGIIARGLGAVAAAAVAGVAGGMAVEHRLTQTSGSPPAQVDLVPPGGGVWVAVAKADAIPVGGVLRFTSDYIVGFVRHTETGFSALSGVCTHMGCMLLWNPTPRTFDCPCHGGRFSEDGTSAPSSSWPYKPLPSLLTRVEDGQVQVYVVPPATPTTADPTQQYGERAQVQDRPGEARG